MGFCVIIQYLFLVSAICYFVRANFPFTLHDCFCSDYVIMNNFAHLNSFEISLFTYFHKRLLQKSTKLSRIFFFQRHMCSYDRDI